MPFGRALALVLGMLVVLRFVLMADLSPLIVFAPHDDSLYVTRALHLLREGAFGPYDSRVLAKLPGMSYLLAGLRTLGLPYFVALNILYVAAGLYVLAALRRCGVGAFALIAVFALYLFNPVTMGVEWTRVLREPVSTVLLVATLGAMLHAFSAARDGLPAWRHVLALAVLVAAAMLLREEDVLLWALLGFFALALWFGGMPRDATRSARTRRTALLLVLPVVMILAVNQGARAVSERWYGLPILHDYGEGEYPRMLAAIRGIVTAKDNRLVMVTQEALARLRAEVPEFAPTIDLLPPPGPATLSCRLQGVCSEWSNGWMPFWIKDAAFLAGKTPDLPAAQAYFRRIREGIEAACAAGRLTCRDTGAGFLPRFELRWTRAYVHALMGVAGMGVMPAANPVHASPARFNVAPELGRVYQAVTMTDHFDSQLETSHAGAGGRLFGNPLAGLRPAITLPFQVLAALLLVFSFAALAFRWLRVGAHPPDALLWISTVFYAFILLRVAALAYAATYMGPFDPRVMFSNHIVALMLAPLIFSQAWRVRRAALPGAASGMHP